jgi:hypothetical protein
VLKPISFPSGGVAAIYRQVELLNAHGLPAWVALRRKPRVDFYQTKAPLLIYGRPFTRSASGLKCHVRIGDVWVIPEVYPDIVRVLAGTATKRILFCQNHFYLPFTSNPKAGLAEFGVDSVVASTEATAEFFRDVYGLDVPLLRSYAIDRVVFAPAKRKTRQIAFMPRKLPQDALFIQATFRRRHSRYADVPWVSIDGVAQAEAARIMSESAVFLSLSFKDSLGLPSLEAMSCGCLVAGYHGEGGRTYMTAENGWWADTGDWRSCVDGLAAAIDLFDRGGSAYDARRQAMDATIETYSMKRFEKDVIAFWRRELGMRCV